MAMFTAAEQKRVLRAIAEAEKGTSGEIVCVVARAASSYSFAPMAWAAVVALMVPWPLLRFTVLSAERIHLVQLAAFALLAILLAFIPNRAALVPPYFRRRRAHRAALEHFQAQGMVRTAHRTGCLIYVAEAERFAEVLVDEGIAAKVEPAVWRETIEVLTEALRQRSAADGFVKAIALCGSVLKVHAPPREGDTNEIPDRLILL